MRKRRDEERGGDRDLELGVGDQLPLPYRYSIFVGGFNGHFPLVGEDESEFLGGGRDPRYGFEFLFELRDGPGWSDAALGRDGGRGDEEGDVVQGGDSGSISHCGWKEEVR